VCVCVCPCGWRRLEDLWHAFNLIVVGDEITALAVRKVQRESSTGSVDSQRVRMNLTVRVLSIDFDPDGEELRLSGAVRTEVDGVRLGSRHTLTLEPHRQFTLRKEEWDSVSIDRLREAAADASASAQLWAVLIKEGLAQLCHVTGGMTIVKAKLETHIPKKGAPVALLGAKKAREHWFEQLLAAILRHVNFAALRCVVLAGPGFTKDAFWEWLGATAAKRELRDLHLSRPKWVLAHASSAYKHALQELLLDPAVAARVADTRAGAEINALREFLDWMSSDPDRVTYGLRHVRAAGEQGAIAKLLLVDSLFRAQNVQRRAEYVQLVEACKAARATVLIFSDQHVTGSQLRQLSGVAAILRFPLPLEDLEEEDDDDEEDEASGDDASGDDDDTKHERGARLEIT
jgi:protein pelota